MSGFSLELERVLICFDGFEVVEKICGANTLFVAGRRAVFDSFVFKQQLVRQSKQ